MRGEQAELPPTKMGGAGAYPHLGKKAAPEKGDRCTIFAETDPAHVTKVPRLNHGPFCDEVTDFTSSPQLTRTVKLGAAITLTGFLAPRKSRFSGSPPRPTAKLRFPADRGEHGLSAFRPFRARGQITKGAPLAWAVFVIQTCVSASSKTPVPGPCWVRDFRFATYLDSKCQPRPRVPKGSLRCLPCLKK